MKQHFRLFLLSIRDHELQRGCSCDNPCNFKKFWNVWKIHKDHHFIPRRKYLMQGSLGHFRKTTQEKLRNGIIFFFFFKKGYFSSGYLWQSRTSNKSTCWDSWRNRISVEIPEGNVSQKCVHTLTHTHNFLYRPKKKKKRNC